MIRGIKHLTIFLLFITLSLHAGFAIAQGGREGIKEEEHEPVEVTVSGEITVEGVFRSDDLTRHRGIGIPAGPAEGELWVPEDGIRLRLDLELTEKVSCHIGLRSERQGDSTEIDV